MAHARLSTLFLVALFGCKSGGGTGGGTCPPAAGAATPTEVVAAGKQAVEQYRQGFEVRSLEAVAPLYEHLDTLVVVHQGVATVGWAAFEPTLAAMFATATEVRVRAKDVVVTALGADGAVVNATLSREISDGVARVEDTGPLTLVLRRVGDDWRIVTEHYSFAPRAQ